MSKARKKRGLGRGIGEIFGGGGGGTGAGELPVGDLRPGPWQPRERIDPKALKELARTIAERGVLQPILVRRTADGHEIIAGERRWRASKMAGLRTVPVVVRELSDRDAMLAALVENIQREDLNVLEQARAARRLIDELSLSVKDAAASLGMSRPALSNLLRLLELDREVLDLLADDSISAGHARAIAALPPGRQARAARLVVDGGLTVRQVEDLAGRAAGKAKGRRAGKASAADPDTKRLCDELSAKLGMRVRIVSQSGRKGRLVIQYSDLDALDHLVRLLRR